jgi:hypothetical protein
MPSPKQKRIIVLQSSYSPSKLVANLNLTMDAHFTTHSTVNTANTFEDASTTGTEDTEYQMAFSSVGAGPIGALTVSFSGHGDNLANGVSAAKIAASLSSVPRATSTAVTPIPLPDHSFERVWQQPALDGANTLVDQVGAIDVRVKAEHGYTVTQMVTSSIEDELILTYLWTNSQGLHLASGNVKLLASSSPFGDFTLAEATVTDDSAQSGRGAQETGKALRMRLRELAREIRRPRTDVHRHG